MSVELKKFLDDKGRPIELGPKLGAGGEGAVYQVANAADRVVKIYHKPPSPEQMQKLRAMTQTANEKLLTLSTWPISLVTVNVGPPVGFIMPKLRPNYKEVLQLYSPANRKKSFPQADYSFVVHAAMNIAAVFDAIHSAGHVVGDVNQKNILISDQAVAMLIDCDSFQIKSGDGKIFPCAVGVAEFTPPELQHKQLREEVRTFNHDNFGLAVLIFELLFLGRHPFAGKYLGTDDPPDLEQAIGRHMFPYKRERSDPALLVPQALYVPPPLSVPVNIFPDNIMAMFEKAFCGDGSELRPEAEEWRITLKKFKDSLILCPDDPLHKYPGSCARCPWCEFAEHGTFYFGSTTLEIEKLAHLASKTIVTEFGQLFNLLHTVNTVNAPLPVGAPNDLTNLLRLSRLLFNRRMTECLIVIMFAFFVYSIALNQPWLIASVILICVVLMTLGHQFDNAAKQFELNAQKLKKRIDDLTGDIKASIPDSDVLLVEMMKTKLESYKAIDSEMRKKLDELKRNTEDAQKKEYLSHFPIEVCPGLAHKDVSTLRSFSVATAADISRERLAAMRWMDLKTYNGICAWKEQLLTKFKPDPNKPIAPSVVHGVISSYKHRAHDLEIELEANKEHLVSMRNTCWNLEKTAQELESTKLKLARTEADIALLRK